MARPSSTATRRSEAPGDGIGVPNVGCSTTSAETFGKCLDYLRNLMPLTLQGLARVASCRATLSIM